MSASRFLRQLVCFASTATLVALFCVQFVQAQQQQPTNISVDDSDRSAAQQAQNVYRHARPISTPHSRDDFNKINPLAAANRFHHNFGGNRSVRYPADLEFNGGNTIHYTQHHAVFVNTSSACPANGCWGNPIRFLRDLGKSDFIHVVDQYTGDYADNRYTVGDAFTINYPVTPGKPLTDTDMETIAYSIEKHTGQSGYEQFVHVFLPPGQDICFDSSDSVCYSPDNLPTWFFCAYHGSFDSDLGHTVYSVEPYQNVSGCNVGPNTPNGQLADSTNSVLSHEVFEAITDPDGDAWWNTLNNGLYGQEIGDECSFLLFTPNAVYFDPSIVKLDDHFYAAQPEYNNNKHACTTRS